MPEEKTEAVPADVKVNLDAEYFKWKEDEGEQGSEEKKADRTSLFGKVLKGEK